MYALGKFPTLSGIACKSKWSWSTIWLYEGTTSSCHRCDKETIDPSNFKQFHNTPGKIKQRESMLQDKWPGQGCEFCRDVEDAGGVSDRIVQTRIPTFPKELVNNVTTHTTPTTLEVFFDNKCNLSCVYCCARNSSRIYNENRKFGSIPIIDMDEMHLPSRDKNVDQNKKLFWEWMKEDSNDIEHFNILGGEPFMQSDFDDCLRFFDKNPRPMLTVTAISNLMVPPSRFKKHISQMHNLAKKRKVRRVDITASIDGWGPTEEFVRFGLDLKVFEQNMKYLLQQGDWLRVYINQTVTSLSIRNIPTLIDKINEWRKIKDIGHYGGLVVERPHLDPMFFGPDFWKDTFKEILCRLKNDTYNEKQTYDTFAGIGKKLMNSPSVDYNQIEKLFVYLDELDRRRGTTWRDIFPYLTEFER